MIKNTTHRVTKLDKIARKIPNWVGTPQSLFIHTLAFVAIFGLKLLGVGLGDILLILTTAVSLEAIYLSILIQMTVNQHTSALEDVEEDIEDLQEDVEEISEDIDSIQASGVDKIKKLFTLDPLRKRGLL